ncbi:hypothetical protein BC828DRAFT_407509 [Blastocladiella britannica]|nr:hypothetical protein BC828DRAFT_407509 [Blastocladiella britannica]
MFASAAPPRPPTVLDTINKKLNGFGTIALSSVTFVAAVWVFQAHGNSSNLS